MKTISVSDLTYKIIAPVIEALETVVNSPILAKVDKSICEKVKARYEGENWDRIEKQLIGNPEILRSIQFMEDNGHEPIVFQEDEKGFWIVTGSKETPQPRNIDYREAVEKAKEWGVELMSRSQYCELNDKCGYDTKTWCWLNTPREILDTGYAFYGSSDGLDRDDAGDYSDRGSLRVALGLRF